MSWSQLPLQGPLSCPLPGAARGSPGGEEPGALWPGPPVAPSLWSPGECTRRGEAIHHCLGLRNSGEGNSSCPHLSLTPAWLPILEGGWARAAWRNSTFAQTEENAGPTRLCVYRERCCGETAQVEQAMEQPEGPQLPGRSKPA